MTPHQSAILWGVYGFLLAFLLLRAIAAWITTRREKENAKRIREKTYW